MNISIFGLGYVGCVSLGCLAKNGHNVIGVDINDLKVGLINNGKPTIVEKDIDKIITEGHRNNKISATDDYKRAVKESEISIICVGTPSTDQGHLNLKYIYNTARQIAESLKEKNLFHTIAIRSTVLPGTNLKVGEIIEQNSGKIRNKDFAVVSNPEFLREGSAVKDYFNPPVTVLGSDNDFALDIMEEVYEKVMGSTVKTQIEIAELIKYVNNAFHALKITFANEVGNICKKLKIDSHELMDLFCMDTQLNISSYYLKPGFAYGGSCLPKDLKALKTLAHDNYLEAPVLNNIENSNFIQKKLVIDYLEKIDKKKILVLGISFKPGTDDLRYSPIIEVIQNLTGKGYEVKLYDKNVNLSKLIGKNKSYIMEKLPHIAKHLIDNIVEAVNWSDLIVITNNERNYKEIEIPDDKLIYDLTRHSAFVDHPGYEGISW